jgi:hypothetical protein
MKAFENRQAEAIRPFATSVNRRFLTHEGAQRIEKRDVSGNAFVFGFLTD